MDFTALKLVPRGTGDNSVRWLLKGEIHATKDTRINDRSPADPGFACLRSGWFVRNFGQHRLDLRHAGDLAQRTSKLSSKRHRTNTGPDTRSVVQLSIELWHAGNWFNRHPHPGWNRAGAGAYAGAI